MKKTILVFLFLALIVLAACGGGDYDPTAIDEPEPEDCTQETHAPDYEEVYTAADPTPAYKEAYESADPDLTSAEASEAGHIYVIPNNHSQPPQKLQIGDRFDFQLTLREIYFLGYGNEATGQHGLAASFDGEAYLIGNLHIVRNSATGYHSTVFYLAYADDPQLNTLPVLASHRGSLALHITNPGVLDEYLQFALGDIGDLDIWVSDARIFIDDYTMRYDSGVAFYTAAITEIFWLRMLARPEPPINIAYFFAENSDWCSFYDRQGMDAREFLDSFDYVHKYDFGAMAFGTTLLMWPDVPVNDLQLFTIRFCHTLMLFYADTVLYTIPELRPGEVFVVEDFYSIYQFPAVGISFIGENNERRHFWLFQDMSGFFPPYVLREFTDRTNRPPMGVVAGVDPTPAQQAAIARLLGEFELGEVHSTMTIAGEFIEEYEMLFRTVTYSHSPGEDAIRILTALGYSGFRSCAIHFGDYEPIEGRAVLLHIPHFNITQLVGSWGSVLLDWAYDFRG